MATTLIRVHCAEGYDSIPLPMGTDLDVYIDDQGLSATGKSRFVVSSIVSGAKVLDQAAQQEFGCSFALDKTALVASSKAVGPQVQEQPNHLCQNCSPSTVNLGVDCAAGRALRVAGKSANMKSRLAKSARAARRLGKQAKVISRAATLRVYSAGPLAGAAYGTEVTGISDRDLSLLRRMFFGFSVVRPRSQLRSLTTRALLDGNPTWRTATAPVTRWSKEVWISQTAACPWSLNLPSLNAAWRS
eukprot:6202218-Pyramimonas_sp.AAC.1